MSTPVRWMVHPLDRTLDRLSIARRFAALPDTVLLESIAQDAAWGRYSYYAAAAQTWESNAADPFAHLEQWLRPAAQFDEPPPLPFVGGWIGWLGYECGRFIEPFARQHTQMPGVPPTRWCACDTLLVHDRAADAWFLAGCELPHLPARPPLAARIKAMKHWLALADEPPPLAPLSVGPLQSNITRHDYDTAIERCLEYIRAGDIYQVNFAQRFSADATGDPWHIHERLSRTNPAMFAAYLPWDRDEAGTPRAAVISSSPELFLELRDKRVVTRPIKGTRPRAADPAANAAAIRDLESSEKERAELVMIVDLQRNDLGRVCEYGSVRVTNAGETESHPTVFHRVATVEATLRDDCDAVDLLRATFPGGSITGAPKVRAMQIIDELEPHPRGPYCGSIGWIGVNGDMLLNIAIRTMLLSRGQIHLWAGGGIVADSHPTAEYAETLAKAEGMRAALEHLH